MKVGFWIPFALITLLAAAVLELNRNTLLGWALLLVLAVAFVFAFAHFAVGKAWYLRLLMWLCYLALFCGIVLLTWPPVKAVPVWEYLFTKSNGMLSSWHSGELIYAFGRIPGSSRLFDVSDRNLSSVMNTYWLNFATTGDPNGSGVPAFPQNSDSKKLMQLGSETGEIDEPYLKLYGVLDRMQGFSLY